MNSQILDDGIPISSIPEFNQYVKGRVNDSIHLSNCTAEEVSEIITALENGKSSDIPINIIKKSPVILSTKLAVFFNKFLREGIFPAILKVGNITPVYKKGNPQFQGNYRPISTLPLFGKIFEKIIYKRLYSYLITKNILYDKQFGFRKGHSTCHALNYSVNYVSEAVKNKMHVIGIFIDLSKAFDTIDHNKLLSKLENYGIRGNCYQLIKNYISPRTQHTTFLNEKSNPESVLFGVPQGSVLGPLLFLLYINDIINASNEGLYVLFADDTNIFVVAKTEIDAYKLANKILSDVNNYMMSNQLHINLGKCTYMYFRPMLNNKQRLTCARARIYNPELTINLNGKKIKKVDSTRFLGVIIDDKLTWEKHIDYLESKLKSAIVMIKRIKKFIPKSKYNTIYHSLFASHLSYCISVWGGTYKTKLSKIFLLQKRCLRILFGKELSFDHPEFYETCARVRTYQEHMKPKDYSLEHTKPIFNSHGLLSVHSLYRMYLFMETFKILKYHRPISSFSLFQVNRNTKRNLIIPPKSSLDIVRNNFVSKASNNWNKCVKHVFAAENLDQAHGIIIPGSAPNSDLTSTVSYIKNRIRKYLLGNQKLGNPTEWSTINYVW